MDNLFYGLSVIIAIGAAVAIVMRAIGQPLMIGHILTGVIIGPAALHVLDSPDTLKVFGTLGIALLLFIIGLGMKPKVVKEVGKPSMIVTATQMIITGTLAWFVTRALGLSHAEAFFVSIGLTINSTIVALKLLSDKREVERLHGKLTIGASLVEDVIAGIFLLFIASAHDGQWLSVSLLGDLVIKGLIIGIIMYLVSTEVLPHAKKLIANDQEVLFLFAIAWGLGSAALLAKSGFSLEVGALAAGISLAGLPYAQEIASRLRPLRDFFVIVFFIALGTELSLRGFTELIPVILAAVLIVVVLKPLIIMATLGFLGYTKRTSFKTALALTQVSEFSIILVILGQQQGLISQKIVSMLTFIALITIAISTYLVTYSDKVYANFEKYLGMFERRHTNHEQKGVMNYDFILFGYRKGGHEFVRVFKQLKKSFVVVDYDPEVIETMEHRGINYLYGDATDIELLEEAGISTAKLVVSTITDYEATSILLRFVEDKNPSCVVICEAESAEQAATLYRQGASYVILPHFIGSEKIGDFIRTSGVSKSAFHTFRNKHLKYLEEQFGVLDAAAEHERHLGHAIVQSMAALTKPKN